MTKKGNVYVVCTIDAEGPIDDKKKPEILNTWERVDSLIDRLTSQDFRMRFPDSEGKGLVYSWFILHLTGFKTNPFNRPVGYHVVYDHYLDKYKETMLRNNDGRYWHYHHPAPSGVGNEWCSDWTHCTEYHNILSHMVLDRNLFPSCFRAGGRIEDDDLSNWIEQWIPFDFSNCSGNVNWNKVESDGKRLKDVCDWTRASQDWTPYHPSKYDYQSRGEQKRAIFRCPDLNSAVHVLTEDEIRKAFTQVESAKDSVLAFFEHDRRDNVIDEIANVCRGIYNIAQEFPSVRWFYKNAKEAAQKALGFQVTDTPSFSAEICQQNRIFITTDIDIFGEYPYLCALITERYEEIPVHIIGKNKWLSGYIDVKDLKKIGIAANSSSGNSCVNVFDYDCRVNKLIKKE